mgnify:CR=1 FL=1
MMMDNLNEVAKIGNHYKEMTGNRDVPTLTLYLFGRHRIVTNQFSHWKYWKSCIWKNGVLKQHLIPALDPSKRPCMFDLVTKTPFYNKGTGEFLYG